jgi:hypothetical protein
MSINSSQPQRSSEDIDKFSDYHGELPSDSGTTLEKEHGSRFSSDLLSSRINLCQEDQKTALRGDAANERPVLADSVRHD